MKKILIIIIIFMCFGCGKSETITINIYEKDKEENTEEVNDVYQNSQIHTNDETDSQDKTRLIDEAKNWYDENKDEIKDKSSDLFENVKEKVIEFKGKAIDWYDENKDEIKDNAKELYEKAKDKKNELRDKYYEWYYNNSDDDE